MARRDALDLEWGRHQWQALRHGARGAVVFRHSSTALRSVGGVKQPQAREAGDKGCTEARMSAEKEEVISSHTVPRTVWILGFVSLLMDLSSELIHSVLPMFLVGTLGASAVTLGLIE